LILRHNFIQQLSKSIADRFVDSDGIKDKFKFGKNGLKNTPNNDKNGGKDLITNSDKSHLCWHIKNGENDTNNF